MEGNAFVPTWKKQNMSQNEQVVRKFEEVVARDNIKSSEVIKEAQLILETALSAPVPDTELISATTLKLEKAYIEEEAYWKQRSRILWLQCGDRNSGFFHAITRGRRQINNFSILEDDEGKVFDTEEGIVATISNYFRHNFTSSGAECLDTVNEALNPCITQEDNDRLIAIPDRTEVYDAVFAIHADKAPGPDGFSAGFYHSFWNTVGEDVYQDIREFFETGYLHPRQNETHVRLIAKISGPRKVADFRPIALCSTHYKIIAKILTKRLQPLLPRIISPHQSAFVPKRAIGDNVLITHEILHFLRTSKAKVRCSMAIKTDMSKAYDRIEWSFLEAVLRRLGFHDRWISWIMVCVTSVSYSFLINGAPQGKVMPSRGIRQGDPLSPYLFILCTEVLSGLCSNAQVSGILPGVKVARNCPPINHLLFADDTMFFTRTDQESCNNFLAILAKYERASGQCINPTKSSITFSSKTPLPAKNRVKSSLSIEKEGGIGKYLGLPEHFGRRKRDIFNSILDRIRQKILGWSTRFLSGAGKEVLLKSVLTAIPAYAMSCFMLPTSLCKQIQSLLTRFWWDSKPEVRKMCWVAWSKLTLPKNLGGMGFRDIKCFNQALLGKIAWRLIREPNSLLAQTLLGKYCHAEPILNGPCTSNASHGWRGILWGCELLKLGLGWSVGNGSQIQVWADPWLSPTAPVAPIGPPPSPASQLLKVSDLIDRNTKDWDLNAIRQHLPLYEDRILEIILSSLNKPDELSWLPETSGCYTSRSGYALARKAQLNEVTVQYPWRKCIWNLHTSPKIKNFLWRTTNGALPVGSTLLIRGLQAEAKCKRCGELETPLHLFLTCPFAAQVWDLVPALHKPVAGTIASMRELLSNNSRMVNLPPTGLGLSPLFPWIYWLLWKNRNRLVFEGKSFTAVELVTKALKEARSWEEATAADKVPPPTYPPRPRFPAPQTSTAFNCFTDGAWDPISGNSGQGWVFVDPSGVEVRHHFSNRLHVAAPIVAEALAVKAALLDAVTHDFTQLNLFSDSKSLVNLLNSSSSTVLLNSLLFDIRALSCRFDSISFSFIPRLNNASADSLAKIALSRVVSPPFGA
ncbi:uncharacterized protein LOC130495882 [Raphanus sativus]|uniref:Uncharacterized protein LOC130495882 n=1 Tax=Raphanus sativus TaxID=3726 RepID=A0A9W3BW39_RAPSA|nr:uncharacterized protein LOC130495882 [Raphanus sativus]